jgi:succinyl-CoA synthetase beta subunit
LEEVRTYADEILGKNLVTHQTGPEGKEVKRLLIEEGCDIKKEYYVGLVVDRTTDRVVLMASEEGGMEIEEVAAKTPEKIFKEVIDPVVGLTGFQARRIAFNINIPKELVGKAAKFMISLYNAFVDNDCSIAEINPLVVTGDGNVLALDAKLNFDDNALFRHKDILEYRDLDEEDPKEIEASKYDLSYISLDGNIGCMVNGAGLAMATMDIIKHYGGEPANFLDVGGGATAEKVTEAFKIILSDEHVKGIFVNIFGGIMKCDVIATGVVEAARQVGLKVPLVVRLEGTNVDLGKKILNESGLNIIAAESMADGAQKIVELVS